MILNGNSEGVGKRGEGCIFGGPLGFTDKDVNRVIGSIFEAEGKMITRGLERLDPKRQIVR